MMMMVMMVWWWSKINWVKIGLFCDKVNWITLDKSWTLYFVT